jgi:hypothetical protein
MYSEVMMKIARWVGGSVVIGLLGAPPAWADANMTCSTAMTLVHNNPAIETNAVMSVVANAWEAMDKFTVARGFAPIAPKMLGNSASIELVGAQCQNNPGEPLTRAAAQVYRQARKQMDGF